MKEMSGETSALIGVHLRMIPDESVVLCEVRQIVFKAGSVTQHQSSHPALVRGTDREIVQWQKLQEQALARNLFEQKKTEKTEESGWLSVSSAGSC